MCCNPCAASFPREKTLRAAFNTDLAALMHTSVPENMVPTRVVPAQWSANWASSWSRPLATNLSTMHCAMAGKSCGQPGGCSMMPGQRNGRQQTAVCRAAGRAPLAGRLEPNSHCTSTLMRQLQTQTGNARVVPISRQWPPGRAVGSANACTLPGRFEIFRKTLPQRVERHFRRGSKTLPERSETKRHFRRGSPRKPYFRGGPPAFCTQSARGGKTLPERLPLCVPRTRVEARHFRRGSPFAFPERALTQTTPAEGPPKHRRRLFVFMSSSRGLAPPLQPGAPA